MDSGAWQTDRLSHSEAHFGLQLCLVQTDREGERLWQTEIKLAACVPRLWIPLGRWERGGGQMRGKGKGRQREQGWGRTGKSFSVMRALMSVPQKLSDSNASIKEPIRNGHKWSGALCKGWWRHPRTMGSCVYVCVRWQRLTEVRWSRPSTAVSPGYKDISFHRHHTGCVIWLPLHTHTHGHTQTH